MPTAASESVHSGPICICTVSVAKGENNVSALWGCFFVFWILLVLGLKASVDFHDSGGFNVCVLSKNLLDEKENRGAIGMSGMPLF